jgi:hypothetical protein
MIGAPQPIQYYSRNTMSSSLYGISNFLTFITGGIEYVMLSVSAFVCFFVVLAHKLTGYHIYQITDDKLTNYYKYVYGCSRYKNDRPIGWCFGVFNNTFHIGYITNENNDRENNRESCTILCSKSLRDELGIFTSQNYVTYDIDYDGCVASMKTLLPSIDSRDQQTILVEKVDAFYKRHKFSKILLHGVPGSGKTYSKYVIGKLFDGCHFLSSYNPTQVGFYRFSDHYRRIGPTEARPLIISFDEIDMMIDRIHTEQLKSVPENKHGRQRGCEIKNKKEWSYFMDTFSEGLYPYVIILCTTNKPLSYFNDMDQSYFREGRINICMEFK